MFLTKIVSFFTAFMVMLSSLGLIFEPKIPKAPTKEALLSAEGFIKKREPASTLYVVDARRFNYDEKMTASALQGLVNREKPCLYLITGWVDREYLNDIAANGTELIETNGGEEWTFASFLRFFKSYVTDSGYTLFRKSDLAEGLNAAVNYCTVYGYLPVSTELEDAIKKAGFTKKIDISQQEYSYAFQEKVFHEVKDLLNKGAVIHVNDTLSGPRDLAVQQKFYCFYTASNARGEEFLKKVLKWSGKNTAIEGWCEHEKHFVTLISKLGCFINPADYCMNTSYLSSYSADLSCFNEKKGEARTDAGKHYVTLVYSDGDNCQWIQNGFSEYNTFVSSYPQSKMNWTFSPALQELASVVTKRVYSKANNNQSFAAGVSGYGYANPSVYDPEALDGFTALTASAMLKSKQRVVTILDDYKATKDAVFAHRLGYYSRFNNIDGGILFLDPNGYRSGKGKVWFSNDKPFVSVRMSLWAEGGYDGATQEWINERAKIINSYPVDIHSVNGYSAICVHAWSMSPAAVEQFINALDPHVELLSVEDFIATVKANIPHQNAAPEKCFE